MISAVKLSDLCGQSVRRRAAYSKWLSEKVETINLRVPKGSKEIIKNHAEKHGESTNAFVYRTVMGAIERDKQADSDR